MTPCCTAQVHVVTILGDDSDYPVRAFESLIEAKAFAMGRREKGNKAAVCTLPLQRAEGA